MMWTIVNNGVEVVADHYDERGLFGVPVTADGISTTVEFIRLGAYGAGWNVGLTRPTARELEILDACGWEVSPAGFAHIKGE